MSDIYKASGPASGSADTGKTDIGAAVGKAKAAVADRAEAAVDWAGQQGEALRGAVADKPFAAVGISAGAAFAAGLLVGLLLAKALD